MIDWAALYADSFRPIERVLALNRGFLLLPVESPGPDPGRALARWLSGQGRTTTVIEPRDDASWEKLVGLLHDAKVAPNGMVIVLGGRRLPKGIYEGLWLLNQKRDVIAKKLGCPLLWCGPRDFLALTWERAPDLWSIRAVDRKLERPKLKPRRPKPNFGGPRPAYSVETPRPNNRADLLHTALEYFFADDLDQAAIALSWIPLAAPSRFRGEDIIIFISVKISALRCDWNRARKEFQKVESTSFVSTQQEQQLILGQLDAAQGRWDEGIKNLQAALQSPLAPEARFEATIALAKLHLQRSEPEMGCHLLEPIMNSGELQTGLHTFQLGGLFADLRLWLDAVGVRAKLTAALGDAFEAVYQLEQAREQLAGHNKELQGGQPSALCLRIARAALEIEADAEGTVRLRALARETAEQALALAQESGDVIARHRAEEVLAQIEYEDSLKEEGEPT